MHITLKRVSNELGKPIFKQNMFLGFYVPYISDDNEHYIKVWSNGHITQISNGRIEIVTPDSTLINPWFHTEIVIRIVTNNIPNKHKFEFNLNEINDSSQVECSICLNEFKDKEIIIKTKCTHLFHHDCMKQWLKMKTSCPFCRTPQCLLHL